MKKLQFICLILLIISSTASISQLDLDKIMSGNEFIGYQPEDIVWSPNSQVIYFRWKHENETVAPYYAYSLADKKYRKLSAEETLMLPVDGFMSDDKNAMALFSKGDRLFEWTPKATRLIYSKYSPFYVHAILDANRILLREGDNLFLFNKAELSIRQITFFQKGNKSDSKTAESFLINQQEELFEIVRADKKRKEDRTNFYDAHSFKEISPVYLEGKYLSFISVNKQLTQVIFGLDKYPEDTPTHIEEYVNASGYSKSVNARPKVGSEDPQHEIYCWNLKEDTCFQVQFDHLTDVKKRPEFFREYEKENFKSESDQTKKMVFLDHGFNDAGDKYLVEIKSYDNKDRWIVCYDTLSKKCIEIEHQHDEKWIGGPGISGWKMEAGNVGWINSDKVYFQSEESGYSHLYTADISDESKIKKENLTTGNFEIHQATLSKDKTKFFITANKNHPGNREFYSLDIATKKLTPILTADGNHEVYISPDEKFLAVNYSYKNKPWELYLAPLKENSALTQITNSTTSEFSAYNWRAPEVITFKAEDGTTVYARLYEPKSDVKNGAGVIFVHGAGYLQNAHNWWSSYHREFMFNNLLADKGFTVLDIDYRASEGYGKNFRTDIYRHMGGADLSDHLDGRDVLIKKYGIDSTRVGIYGGSYGGFITLMAMLTEPGKFKCGAALRSVTDWAHYNHEYTSNILNTPEEDPIAYKRSSPIYFAEGLQGRLLMLHGIEDDNVQYQDVVRLSQRFIELKKKNWDLIGYPIEPHGFVETTSWIDEYRRILEMFEEELN
jgi:dipeptidyl aminopeptidase/acylaminoacyl peptidase